MGAGAAAAVAFLPSGIFSGERLAGPLTALRSTKIDVRAIGGLPQGPFPSYATYVIEGTLDVKSQSGILTKSVFAGPPEAMTTIALPGLTRVIRVTGVHADGGAIRVSGMIDDKLQLKDGESSEVSLTLDRSNGMLRTEFLKSDTTLNLV